VPIEKIPAEAPPSPADMERAIPKTAAYKLQLVSFDDNGKWEQLQDGCGVSPPRLSADVREMHRWDCLK